MNLSKVKSKGSGLVLGFYIPTHFKIQELVPPTIYNTIDDKNKLWFLFDDRILWTIDAVRDLYGSSILVNNWYPPVNGQFTDRGWRAFESTLTPLILVDEHKLGRAIDMNITGVTPDSFVSDVLSYPDQYEFQFITGLEIAPTWNHIDCRNFNKKANNNKSLTFQK